jgi:predicted HTH transcriptional regulator
MDITRLFTDSRSIPHNKNIARIFHEFDLIEQWGSGFQRMHSACIENNNLNPQFKEVTGASVLNFYHNVVEKQDEIIHYIRLNT